MHRVFGWYVLLSLFAAVFIGVFAKQDAAFVIRILIFISWALLAIGIYLGRSNEEKNKDT